MKVDQIKKKFRVGVIAKSKVIPLWAYTMLEKIQAESDNDIALIVLDDRETKKRRPHQFVYNHYRKFDRNSFETQNDALSSRNLNEIADFEYKAISQTNEIREFEIDLFLKLNFSDEIKELTQLSKYGIALLHVGAFGVNNGEAQFFYDIVKSEDLIDMSILLKSKLGTYVLCSSKSSVDNISVHRGVNLCWWRASSMFMRSLLKLKISEERVLAKDFKRLDETTVLKLAAIKDGPNNIKSLYLLFIFTFKRFFNKVQSYFYFEQWSLFFNLDDDLITEKGFSDFRMIQPPKDRFWADPHVIKKNGNYYIFIEELIFSENRGFISIIEMDFHGNYSTPVVILKKNYHLSFPFIFEDNDEIYMVPESSENRTIELYKCVEFPYKWVREKNLMENIKAVDTVVIKRDDKYWLFTNICDPEQSSSYDELYLFYSNSLMTDKWTPHPENPIVSDVQRARMAGAIFEHNNKLFRPAQNCSKRYGYGLVFNEITKLDEFRYRESIHKSIIPDWNKNIKGIHSITAVDNLKIIDGIHLRRK